MIGEAPSPRERPRLEPGRQARWAPPRDGSLARRWTGLTGLLLAATLVPAIALETAGPDSSASARVVASELASSRLAVLSASALFLAAVGCGLVFVVAVTSLARRRDREDVLARVASASGVAAVVVLGVYAAGFGALAASIHDLDDRPQAVYAAFRVLSAIDDASGVFIAVFVAITARLLLRRGLSSRRLAGLGLAAAAVRAVGALDVTTLGALPFAPFMVAGTLLCLTWLVLTSVALLRARPGVRRSAPPARARRPPVRTTAGPRRPPVPTPARAVPHGRRRAT